MCAAFQPLVYHPHIKQKLDHFHPTDGRTWRQRYFVNNAFYEEGGPAFLMIGGEGTASPHWMVSGKVFYEIG